ncbi:MAG: glycosyltransferase [Rhodocyclaceae bacterium]|nr:glycosyltransferase [Rhodocyclaceae bacterium]
MPERLFILVPSPHPTGPIKGAFALANALIDEVPVTIVFVKAGPGADAPLDGRVELVSLDRDADMAQKLERYARMLQDAGGRERVASLSMCYSADWINARCRSQAVTCSSVRGNLFSNYRLDYGLPGLGLALKHLWMLRRMDHVVAMTAAMQQGVRRITRRAVTVIGNFVDERALEQYRVSGGATGPLRFVFVGSLTRRKQPGLLVDALRSMVVPEGARLDILGDGPLRTPIERVAEGLDPGMVTIHGHLSDPLPIVAAADAFVLPSMSEGVSRAALEALCLGVPCVLRQVDGNAELLHGDGRGVLFRSNDSLGAAMIDAARMGRAHAQAGKAALLPDEFRQAAAARQYLDLLKIRTMQ